MSLRYFGILFIIFALSISWNCSASAANFDGRSNFLIQEALQELGYDVGKPDGVWGRRTTASVHRYRRDFGMTESKSLSVQEANQLLVWADWLNFDPGLVSVPSTRSSEGVVEDWAFSAYYPADRYSSVLYGSRRHAMVMEMLSAYPKFGYGDQDLDRDKRVRALRWLENDLKRMREAGLSWSSALVEIDLALTGLIGDLSKEYLLENIIPKIKYLFDDVIEENTPKNTFEYMTVRLFDVMGSVLSSIQCAPGNSISREYVDLAQDIIRRYMDGSYVEYYVLFGYEYNLAKCLPLENARIHLSKRVEKANELGRSDLAIKAVGQWADIENKFGNKKEALNLFKKVFAEATEAEAKGIYNEYSGALTELGGRDFVEPYVLSSVVEVAAMPRTSQVAMTSTRYLALEMMKMGFEFHQIDPLFTSIRDGEWLGNNNPLSYYPMVISTFLDTGDYENAEKWSRRLIERSKRENEISSVYGFRGQLIEALLRLGKLEGAEEQIVFYRSEVSGMGAEADTALASWQSRLRLARREALPVGTAYVEGMLEALPKICRDKPDGSGWALIPAIDRETLYQDPSFLTSARNYGLSGKLADCNGNEWVLQTLERISCYLWASLGDSGRLEKRMSGWIDGLKSDGYIGEDALACPMGIAEAGHVDFLERYKTTLTERVSSGPAGLLLLALDRSGSLTNYISNQWARPESNTNFTNYIDVEVAGRLRSSDRVAKRQRGLGAYQQMNSGAAMDTAEEARIRYQALDLGKGFEALNLHEIALMFYESGLYDVDIPISPQHATSYIYDEEKARFILAWAKLSFNYGNVLESLEISKPMVSAIISEVRNRKLNTFDGLGQWSARLAGFFNVYLSALAADAATLAAADPDFVVMAQQFLHLTQSASSTGRLQSRLASSRPELVRDYQDALRKMRQTLSRSDDGGKRLADQQALVNSLRQELEVAEPNFARTFDASLMNLKDISRLAGGATKVIISNLPSYVLTTVVDGEDSFIRAVNTSRTENSQLVAEFRNAVIKDDLDEISIAGTKLRELLFGEFLGDEVPERIGIIVEGAFAAVPFGALPIEASDGSAMGYLGALSAIAIAPSVGALKVEEAEPADPGQRKPFIGFGDIQFSQLAADQLLGFQPNELRETNSELRFLAAVLGANPSEALYLRGEATEKALSKLSDDGQLSKYAIVAFATHGFLGVSGKLTEPALLLSNTGEDGEQENGLLKVSEIYDLKLNARLVLLSACDTGSIAEGQTGLSDITQAFIYAGARSLMVTHWEIDSGAAVEISKRLALQMKANPEMPVAEALRKSIAELLADPNAEPYHHPRYWASHAVVGLN